MRRHFSTAAVKTKQVFNKKLKQSRTSGAPQIGVNRTAPLSQALFHVDPAYVEAAQSIQSNPEESQRRLVIEAAWKRYEAKLQAERDAWEAAFVRSKLNALHELRQVSEKLYLAAVQPDYSLPPIHRRMATFSPPDPERFPFKQ